MSTRRVPTRTRRRGTTAFARYRASKRIEHVFKRPLLFPSRSGEYSVNPSRARFSDSAARCSGLSDATDKAECIYRRNFDEIRLEVYIEDLTYYRFVETEKYSVSGLQIGIQIRCAL